MSLCEKPHEVTRASVCAVDEVSIFYIDLNSDDSSCPPLVEYSGGKHNLIGLLGFLFDGKTIKQ